MTKHVNGVTVLCVLGVAGIGSAFIPTLTLQTSAVLLGIGIVSFLCAAFIKYSKPFPAMPDTAERPQSQSADALDEGSRRTTPFG